MKTPQVAPDWNTGIYIGKGTIATKPVSISIDYLDVCLPDYFQGFSGDVLAVPVTHETTYRELRELIRDEYNSLCGPEYVNFEKALDDIFVSIYSGAWHKTSMDSVCDFGLETVDLGDDTIDSVYAYFGVTELKG